MLHMHASPLTLAQVHAALASYYDDPDEIDASTRAGRKAVAEIEREQARLFRQRRAPATDPAVAGLLGLPD